MLMLISAMMLGVGDGADDDSDVVGVHEDVDVADDGASLLAPSPSPHPPTTTRCLTETPAMSEIQRVMIPLVN